MPWVNVTVAEPFAFEKQEQVKAGLAAAFSELMDKPEQGLVVTFTAAFGFYRGGTSRTDAVIVDVRYIGEFPLKVKQDLTRRIAELMAQVLGADPMKVTVPISEIRSDNWGRQAGNFT